MGAPYIILPRSRPHRVLGSTVPVGGSEGEPNVPNLGTLIMHQDAAIWDAAYANVTAMGNDTGSSVHIVPQPSPASTGTAVNTSETTLITGGRLVTGKIPRMSWPGTDQQSATFQTYPENGASSVPNNVTHYLQYYFRWTIPLGWNGNRINVKNIESWPKSAITGGRTQINTRYPISDNPDPATCCFECLFGTEVDRDSQQPRGPHPIQELFDGNWHRFTQELRSSSSLGARDGFQRAWIDGIKIIDLSQAMRGVVPSDSSYGGRWCTEGEMARMESNGWVNNGVAYYFWGSVQTNNPDHSQDSNPWTMDIDNVYWSYV